MAGWSHSATMSLTAVFVVDVVVDCHFFFEFEASASECSRGGLPPPNGWGEGNDSPCPDLCADPIQHRHRSVATIWTTLFVFSTVCLQFKHGNLPNHPMPEPPCWETARDSAPKLSLRRDPEATAVAEKRLGVKRIRCSD